MAKIFITRKIPEPAVSLLEAAGHEVTVSDKDGVLTKDELLSALKTESYDAVLCLLTDTIDAEVIDAAPNAKIFANYAVGFDNIDLDAAAERDVVITNTPGVLTEAVAEHTVAMTLSIARRIPEADRFARGGNYHGWAPELLLGMELKGKTLGLIGAGRIGSTVAGMMGAFNMDVVYYDIARNEDIEREHGAEFKETPEEVLKVADVVTLHVPLLDSTRHLMNAERFGMMKKTAYLVNTSRGAVIDEAALYDALKDGTIAGAAIDVFENEPELTPGLAGLENVIVTPHIASATTEARSAMARLAAENILAVLEGREPENKVTKKG